MYVCMYVCNWIDSLLSRDPDVCHSQSEAFLGAMGVPGSTTAAAHCGQPYRDMPSLQSRYEERLGLTVRPQKGVCISNTFLMYVPITNLSGLWDFRLVMWRACRVEGFAVPFAIMGFFEGTCNAFRALLFDADITYWNQIRVDSKEVTRRYKQMMATASYCSLDFISNVFSYLSIRTQQSRRLWSTPRPWTTM